MWAKSVLKQQEEDEDNEESGVTSRALVVKKEKSTPTTRRKRSNSSSSITSVSRKSSRTKVDELLKKEPSQMTMGELALTVPMGKRVNRHEQEVSATSADNPMNNGSGSSNLINTQALNRVRSFSVSSESAAFGGSIVTPQVEIIDGKMVILESTVKISEVSHRSGEFSDNDDQMPRRSGARYYAQPNAPGKRWAKDETKQFYYCLSQVGPNFSMMATLFPNRKRKELKCKFKYEEKHHPALIEIALKASAAPLDTEMVEVIAQMVDKDSQKKQAKQNAHQKKQIVAVGMDSPASTAMATPPPPQADFLDDFEDYYRERKNSFDFAG
uniref:Transcription factor TFIIIB component B'' Myb domain-containing protein n=1 Tax=Globisporangium ultimum (strain ATCC 200006 / CBS 805.95 / DAOM BR144) TaxID=431595 RepID=K3X5D7_GLOUD